MDAVEPLTRLLLGDARTVLLRTVRKDRRTVRRYIVPLGAWATKSKQTAPLMSTNHSFPPRSPLTSYQ